LLPNGALSCLIELGSDLNAIDKEGNTPMHVAKTNSIVSLLLKAGANATNKNDVGQTPRDYLFSSGMPNKETEKNNFELYLKLTRLEKTNDEQEKEEYRVLVSYKSKTPQEFGERVKAYEECVRGSHIKKLVGYIQNEKNLEKNHNVLMNSKSNSLTAEKEQIDKMYNKYKDLYNVIFSNDRNNIHTFALKELECDQQWA